MRVNDWTLHLMAAAISIETFRPEVDLKYSEQSAIEHLVKNEPMYVNKTAIVPQRWYNAFMGPREWDGRVKPHRQITGNSVVEGDLLVHFAGQGDTKVIRMTKFMNAYDKNFSAWQVELHDTEYEKEIEEFWEMWAQVEREREKDGVVDAATDRSIKADVKSKARRH
jgi:galactosyl transferase GMA12/MNN10 family